MKVFLGILAAILLTLAILFAIDYSHYARDKSPYRTLFVPRLELSMIQIGSLTADATSLHAQMLIHNPLPFNLRADSLRYEVYIRGVEVIKSTYPKSLLIRRWDTSAVDLPVVAYNDRLLTVLTQAENEGLDSVEYEVKTYFGTRLFGYRDFNLDIKTLQPLFFIPKIKVTRVEYDGLNGEGVNLYIHTDILNKNKFPFKLKDLKYRVALAGDAWVKGKLDVVIDIKDSGATTPLDLPLRISFKEIGKSLGPLIKKGKNTPYKLELTLKLVSDNNAMKNSEVLVTDKGVIHDIVQLAKDEKKKADDKLRAQGIDPKEHKKEMRKERREKKKRGENVKFTKKKD